MNVYAYLVDRDQFSKFTNFNFKHSSILVGVAQKSNVNLFIDSNNELMEYPGDGYTSKLGVLTTKMYPVIGARIRRVSLEYEGGTPTLTVIAHNRRFPSGQQTVDINITESGRFHGLPVGYKCDYVQFKITGAEQIKMIRYTMV